MKTLEELLRGSMLRGSYSNKGEACWTAYNDCKQHITFVYMFGKYIRVPRAVAIEVLGRKDLLTNPNIGTYLICRNRHCFNPKHILVLTRSEICKLSLRGVAPKPFTARTPKPFKTRQK